LAGGKKEHREKGKQWKGWRKKISREGRDKEKEKEGAGCEQKEKKGRWEGGEVRKRGRNGTG